jgi:hypothetical protein
MEESSERMRGIVIARRGGGASAAPAPTKEARQRSSSPDILTPETSHRNGPAVFRQGKLCDPAERVVALLASLRFVWNATTGHRLRPWRSEYIRWRIETYSGMKAEELRAHDVLAFLWREKGNLLRFLRWTDRMEVWKKAGSIRHGTGE